MMVMRLGALVALAWIGLAGCAVDAPRRASDTQNLNGITDDISATSMTDSDSRHAHDPNIHSTLPHHYETFDQ